MIVPTLCVGMQPGTLRVPFESWNAERPLRHSHAERGNDRLLRRLNILDFLLTRVWCFTEKIPKPSEKPA